MSTHLQEELEHAIGHGPEHRPLEETLRSGHRALRRRRAAGVVAGLAVVGVLGGTWTAAGPGIQPRESGGGFATNAPSAGETSGEEDAWTEGELARYGPDGLELRKGVELVRRVDNPMGYAAPRTSVGLVLDHDGSRTWMLIDSGPGGGGTVSDEAGRTFPTFELWLADAVALWRGEPTLALVRFAEAETLVADEPGVEVVDQRPGPDMPRSFAGPDEQTAVAQVTWNGETWFVLARRLPGHQAEYFPTAASIVGGADTIDEFLEIARERYANSDGLR